MHRSPNKTRRWIIVAIAAVVALLVGGLSYGLAATSGTASASCGAVNTTTGTAPCTGTWSVNVPVPITTKTVTQTVTASPPPVQQPVGDPLGKTWTKVFGDEFNAGAIDTTRWVALNGWGNNNVTSNSKNCTEGSYYLHLNLPGDGTGCDLRSATSPYGSGANAHNFNVGDYLEARIYFPGPGTSATSTLYNWPAFWAYDGSGNWNAGENDIAEALNHMEYNYSSTKSGDLPSFTVPGNWGNSWHVYGLYRTATQTKVYYDGVLKGTFAVNDNGGPEAIMFTSGKSDACCGAPQLYGSGATVKVDWIRDWH